MRRLLLLLALLPSLASAGITFVGTATGGGVTATSCTPGNAASSALADDVALVVLHSRTNTAHTCTTNCSSVGKGSTSWAVLGTQGGATTGGRVSVWWLRLAGNLATAPTFGGPATESYACQMFLFRGVIDSGNPHNATASQAANSSGTTFTGTAGFSTTVAGCMAIFAGGSMTSSTWGTPGGTYNDAVGGYTSNTNGTDNSVFLSYDSTPDPTPIGTITAPTLVQSVAAAGRSQVFALAPATAGSGGMMGFYP